MNWAHQLDDVLDLELLKKGVLVLSAGLIPLVIFDSAWIVFGNVSRRSGISVVSHMVGGAKARAALSFYEAVFEKDTVFGRVLGNGQGVALKTPLAELVKDYRLKGVVLAGEPEAIIEDARTQRTSFVKAGGKLGDLDVKEIRQGSVVLAAENETITLEIE